MKARDRLASAAFAASIVAAIALGVVYWQGGQTQLEGVLLGIALGAIGVGIVLWAKEAIPRVEVTEARGPLASEEEELVALDDEVTRGEQLLTRRKVLTRLAGGAFVALAGALVFPLRSLGPRPGAELKRTPFRAGVRLVLADGTLLRADDLEIDSVVTAFPEGHADAADSPTLVIRTRPGRVQPRPGRDDWAPAGIIAYSKLCTHAGCPVGLYQADAALLLCPCHQSTFDVLDGARPVFGPAARSLPQLPLRIDRDGNLVARGDFSGPVGPGFWNRGR